MMMSAFLAKLLGLYFLIAFFLCAFRKRQVKESWKEIVASKGLLAVSGEISLIFGLVIVLDHSVWELSWRGLVTLMGYLILLKGIMRLAFPAQVKKCATKMNDAGCWVVLIFLLVVGCYLTYSGFTHSV